MSEPRAGAPLWPVPTAVIIFVVVAFALYNAGPPWLANIVFFPYVFSLALGPSIIYPQLRRLRASTSQAVAASLCVPLLWLLKECYAFSAVFNFWETVYFVFNPLSLGFFTWVVLQMAMAELFLRRAWHGKWELVNGPALVAAAIFILGGSFGFLARGNNGTIAYYLYVDLYRVLFGG
jgi:hypothetical protein